MDSSILDILICPETKEKLHSAPKSLLDQLNEAIAAKELRNRQGELISKELDDLLLRESGDVGYPVRDDIPTMLIDEQIDLRAFESKEEDK